MSLTELIRERFCVNCSRQVNLSVAFHTVSMYIINLPVNIHFVLDEPDPTEFATGS